MNFKKNKNYTLDYYINNGRAGNRDYYDNYQSTVVDAMWYKLKEDQGQKYGASWCIINLAHSIEPLIAIKKDSAPLYRYDVILVTSGGAQQECLETFYNATEAIRYANNVNTGDLSPEDQKSYKGQWNEAWVKIDVSQWCNAEMDDTFMRWQYDRDLTVEGSTANELLLNVQRHFNIIDEPILIDNAAVWIGNWVPSIKMLKKILPGAKKYIRILIGKYIIVDKDYVPELYYSSEVDSKIIIKDITTYLSTGQSSKYKAK